MEKNSINKIILIGHVGAKPLSRFTPQGKSTSTFSIATNEIWKDKENKQHEHVEWHNIVVWDKLSDFTNQYLYKGQLIYIEGSLRSRKWSDQEGVKHKIVEVLCSKITPLEWRTADSS